MTENAWSALEGELEAWRSSGRQARLWLRDDDASTVTPALERLTELTAKHRVPLLIAAIPAKADASLAGHLAPFDGIDICVHGYRHANHAPQGEKAQELGAHRPVTTVADELVEAHARLHELAGDRLVPVLVPPWNRIAPAVVERLPGLGFSALSCFGASNEATGVDGLRQVNTHLDIIDWKGARGGRDPAWLAAELAKLLRAARSGALDAVGVLTHHLDHDNTAWRFLEDLFAVTARHPAVRWCSVRELIA